MAGLAEIVGESGPIVALRDKVRRILERSPASHRLPPILILGETGTGKGLLAGAMHRAGPRSDGPFVDVNCAAIPEPILEAEMFGYERGAFTDARQAKPGLLQVAHRGTIFLDEVGLMPLALQAKLLKAIEERAVRRLGGTRDEPVDVWVVSATSADLVEAMRQGRFREDLYHRLGVLTLTLPALRERGDDVLLLAEHLLASACADYRVAPKRLEADARAALLSYPWPGNVRELANAMERVALLVEGPTATAEALGLLSVGPDVPEAGDLHRRGPLHAALADLEQKKLLAALEETGWNITRAAVKLGISRDTLRYRIDKLGLRPPAASGRRGPSAPASTRRLRVAVPKPAAERVRRQSRHLVVLAAGFSLAGSQELPPGAAQWMLLLADKVRTFGGRVMPDAPGPFSAVFGLEIVEDAAIRAAGAAVAIRRALEREGAESEPGLRIAILGCEAPVGVGGPGPEIEAGAAHDVARTLAAMLAEAEPGTTVIDGIVAASIRRRFDLAPAPADGAGQRHRLLGRERTRFDTSQRLATFVGRREESELLARRLTVAAAGHGQVVAIAGDAGIGKSRLVFEFRRSVAERAAFLDAQCVSYGSGTPYLPLLGLLRQTFALAETDDTEVITAAVRRGLVDLDLDNPDTRSPLLHLLGVPAEGGALSSLSPEAIKTRTFEALRRLWFASAYRRPLVLAVDDIHWIDPTSEEWLVSLVERLPGHPLLCLVTYRPGYRPPWSERSYATQLALGPLTPEESLNVVRSTLGSAVVSEALTRSVRERGSGNPFFLEEICRVVAEGPAGVSVVAVPDTVQNVLRARIGRLDDEAQCLLQAAAVLGPRLPASLLQALWHGPLERPLGELTRLEFLREDASRGEPGWAFTHALVQEVVYESLSTAERRALHAEAAQALEGQHPNRLDDVVDRLAHHYSRAERAVEAVKYLRSLAERSSRAYAHAEAVAAIEEALIHVERLPDPERDRCRLDLVLRLVYSLNHLGRFAEVVARLFEDRERFERLDDAALASPYHFWLARTHTMLGDLDRAVEHGRRALAAAERAGDEGATGKALYALAYQCFWSGRPGDGVELGQQAVNHLERATDPWWLVHAHWVLAVNLAQQGAFATALNASARALAIGEGLEDRRLQSLIATTSGGFHALAGDFDAAIAECRRGVDLASDPVTAALARGFLGGAQLERGDTAEATSLLEQAVQEYARFGVRHMQGWFTTLLGEAALLRGDTVRARRLAAEGFELVKSVGYRYGVGWAQRALGAIATDSGQAGEAAEWLVRALETFTDMGARYDVGRTRIALARLAARTGDAAGAAAHLAASLATFDALGLPACGERTRRLGVVLGVALAPG